MFTVTERVYRTADGRLCRHGDPESAFLAFPAGVELSDEEAKRSGLVSLFAPAPEEKVPEKSAVPAPNKMAARPADKGGDPKARPVKEEAP